MSVQTAQLAADAPQPGEPLITVTDGMDRTCWRTGASHVENWVTVCSAIGRDNV